MARRHPSFSVNVNRFQLFIQQQNNHRHLQNFLLWIILIEIHKRSPSTMRIKLAETNKDFIQRAFDKLQSSQLTHKQVKLLQSNRRKGSWVVWKTHPPQVLLQIVRSVQKLAVISTRALLESFHRFWTLRAERPLPPIHWWFFLSMFTRRNKVDCGAPRLSFVWR